MPDILLATVNARYRHCCVALRCLQANLGELGERSAIVEYGLDDSAIRIAEDLLARQPRIIALSVAIWNTPLLSQVIALCKRIAPQVPIVVGGPEITPVEQPAAIRDLADHLISGESEVAFRDCCRALLAGQPWPHLHHAEPPALDILSMPYHLYSEEDLTRRIIYVEATRGCPYRCAFCASAREEGLRRWPAAAMYGAWEDMITRGCTAFKFLDRSFNAVARVCDELLTWFLAHHRPGMHLHAEFVPDRLAPSTRALLQRFPEDAIQLEIGIQSFTPAVLAAIDRRCNLEKACAHIRWLGEHTLAHLHVDLIVGLPEETPASMAASFDRLWWLLEPARQSSRHHAHDIQVGILKRLPNTPLAEMAEPGVFSPEAPYEILHNRHFDFPTMQRWKRFARFAELIINKAHFRRAVDLIMDLDPSPAQAWMAFSDWCWQETGQEHGFSLGRLYDLLHAYLGRHRAADTVIPALAADFHSRASMKGCPAFLQQAVHRLQQRDREQRHARTLASG